MELRAALRTLLSDNNLMRAIRRRCVALLAVAMCIAAPSAAAASPDVRIVLAQYPTPAARETLAALIARFPSATADTDVRRLAGRSGSGIYVSLGPEALKGTLEAVPDGPVLALLISGESYRKTVAASAIKGRRTSVNAILAEASPSQQLMLIQLIFKRRITVGVLLSKDTMDVEPLIRSAAQQVNLDVDVQRIEPGDNPIRALNRLSSANVLLVVPDSAILSPENVQPFLEATYRRSQAVIGFSSALVRAGTLASVYSTVDEIAAHAAMLVEQLAKGQPAGVQYPIFWRVTVNESVARSMNIPVDNEARTFASPTR